MKDYQLPYEQLDPDQIKKRFNINIPYNFVGILEKSGGALFPEKCIEAWLKLGDKH